jgi:predicted Zn finger-like uncharacterized protein
MVIACPQCSTRFRVPDHLIGDKPVKLRCSKCKHVFRYERPPADRPSHPRMPVVRPPSSPAPPPSREPAPAPEGGQAPRGGAAEETYESFEPEEPDAGERERDAAPEPAPDADGTPEAARSAEPAPGERAEPTPGDEAATAEVDVPAPQPPGPAEPTARDAPPAAPAAAPAPSQPSLPTLTLEDVLPEQPPPSRAGRIVGISALAVLAAGLVFALFVLWRNGWQAGVVTSDPVRAVKVAVGAEPPAIVDEEARGIEPAVVDVYKTITGDEREILVVEGEVLNTTVFPKRMIAVEVAIVNSSGTVIKQRETLAGVTLLSREQIRSKSFLEMDDELRAELEQARRWVVRSNRKAKFQTFFTSYPPGVLDSRLYTIEATVTDAENAGER